MRYLIAALLLGSACAPGPESEPALDPTLTAYRATYEERWGHVDLGGWTVRMVPSLPGGLVGLTTTGNGERLIQLVDPSEFPHELHHVQLGNVPGHAGWCLDYEPWQRATLGIDERWYLACPR